MPVPPHMLLPATQTRRLPLRLWLTAWACLRAAAELARARRVFGAQPIGRILRENGRLRAASRCDPERAAQVGFAVTRMARRVPWRADCLVQAIAAQHWLAREGVASEITIGSEAAEGTPFSAHAWLVCGETVVTGGEIARYEVLVGAGSAPR